MKENEAIETLISIRRVSGYSKKREEALDMAIAALEKQSVPVGNMMEVRYAHWVDHGRDNPPTCSNCGGRALLNYESDYCESTNCPHCGARMDGGTDK